MCKSIPEVVRPVSRCAPVVPLLYLATAQIIPSPLPSFSLPTLLHRISFGLRNHHPRSSYLPLLLLHLQPPFQPFLPLLQPPWLPKN